MAIHIKFFEHADGTILLPPTDDTPCPADCLAREANTLAEVDDLQRRLQRATYERCQRELQHDEEAFAAARERVRSDLTSRIASAATTEYERDFLREYIKLREEKRAKYRQRFACDVAYLMAREYDEKKCSNAVIEKLDL